MTCRACAERQKRVRDAFLRGKMIEAAKQAAIGAAEMAGVKRKGGGDGVERD